MTQPGGKPPAAGPGGGGLPEIDLREYGGKKDGERQSMDRRLFMSLTVVDAASTKDDVASALSMLAVQSKLPHVVYADSASPTGAALLSWSEDPAHFATTVRRLFREVPACTVRPGWAMLGRTYATGHEPDLAFTLLERPIKNVLEDAWPWHVWYPLRRTGDFARLDAAAQGEILREHAQIGFAYGQRGLASDVRLACHGLDASDNEFVIGLVGPRLENLSHLVQTMRKTRQTSEFVASMGPFFVGRVLSRSR